MGATRGRRALPLQWRAAALAILAIALLSIVASAAAFIVVRQTLQGDLLETLHVDARRVAALYEAGTAGSARDALVGPTGGVVVQLYDPLGNLLVASEARFEAPGAALPSDVVLAAREHGEASWRGTLGGAELQVALAPFAFGVVAVASDVGFIGRALARLARTLTATALVMVFLSGIVGFTVASAIVRPITSLARRASALGPERLGPIAYDGPDDEVGQLARVLNDLLDRLRQALDGQRAFLAETSHELRTPLTSLQGYLDRAIRHGDPAVSAELRDARRVAHTMSRLVTDLLQLSRGQLVDEIDPHLVDLVQDVAKPISEELPGVRVEGEHGIAVVADPDRLRQLVRNLVTNAVRAAGEASAVLVRVERDDDEVVLSVVDSGPGVPPELQHRIFQKFFRGPGGGSGLGLAIAQQIARAHASVLTFTSVPGDTCFSIRLPVADLDEGEEA